jgi:hypothetical protein
MEIQTIQPFLQYFSNVRERTLRVASCIPPDKIDWTYATGKFTFGDLLRHLAVTERYGYENVLAFLQRLHAESLEIFSTLTPEDLQRKCPTPGGAAITTWKWLRSMAEHEIHHRGQIYLYLSILGVPTPPLYGLTSEQVRARSSTS